MLWAEMDTFNRFETKHRVCLLTKHDARSQVPVLKLADLAGIFCILPIGYLLGVLVRIYQAFGPLVKNRRLRPTSIKPLINNSQH